MEEHEQADAFVAKLNRWLIRYLTIEVGYLILVGVVCLVLWVWSMVARNVVGLQEIPRYDLDEMLGQGILVLMLIAFVGNLVGAFLSLLMFWTGRHEGLRFGDMVGHVLNFALVAGWGVVYVLLVTIISMEGSF